MKSLALLKGWDMPESLKPNSSNKNKEHLLNAMFCAKKKALSMSTLTELSVMMALLWTCTVPYGGQ